jgi:hypothetical protein
MKRQHTRELQFKEGVKARDRGLENTTPTVGCNEERPQHSQPDYLRKTSQAHIEFFFVVRGLTLRFT